MWFYYVQDGPGDQRDFTNIGFDISNRWIIYGIGEQFDIQNIIEFMPNLFICNTTGRSINNVKVWRMETRKKALSGWKMEVMFMIQDLGV